MFATSHSILTTRNIHKLGFLKYFEKPINILELIESILQSYQVDESRFLYKETIVLATHNDEYAKELEPAFKMMSDFGIKRVCNFKELNEVFQQCNPSILLIENDFSEKFVYETVEYLKDKFPKYNLKTVMLMENERSFLIAGNLQKGVDEVIRRPFDKFIFVGRCISLLRSREKEIQLKNIFYKTQSLMMQIAHDIANPLTIIDHKSAKLARKMTDDLSQDIEAIKKNALIIKDILHQVKNMIEAFNLNKQVVIEKVDLIECIDLAKSVLGERIENKQIKINLTGERCTVYCNKTSFVYSVITNILSNSIKFSQKKGIIEIRIEKQKFYALLSIQDFGIGMSSDLKARIMQEGNTSRRGTEGEIGSGMGLQIARMHMEYFGGSLYISSSEKSDQKKGIESGTTVFLSIPLNNANDVIHLAG